MDARIIDKDGLTVCPQCGKHYRPKKERDIDGNIPKDASPMEGEQLITGICSNKCWKNFFRGG